MTPAHVPTGLELFAAFGLIPALLGWAAAEAVLMAMHATGRLVHEANQNGDLANLDLAAARGRAVVAEGFIEARSAADPGEQYREGWAVGIHGGRLPGEERGLPEARAAGRVVRKLT